ncbi:MAG TPA: MFS transporter [Acidimicrobiales bacterium]|nr:MFS transporter [Acidimicrobiales bacterium]
MTGNGNGRGSGAANEVLQGLVPLETAPVETDRALVGDELELGDFSAPAPVSVVPSEPRPSRLAGVLANLNLPGIRATGGLSPLLLLSGVTLTDQLGQSALALLTPNIKNYFGVSLTVVTALTSVVSFMLILGAIPIGFLADRVRRTRMAAFGALVIGVGGVLAGLSPSVILLGGALAIRGFGGAMQHAENSLLADYYPIQVRGGVFAFRQFTTEFAKFIGPILGGLIAAVLVWQAVFIVYAIPAAIIGFMVLRLRDPVRGMQERLAMGASREVAETEERPPSLGESFRLIWSVRSLRRTLYAAPFLAGALIGILTLFQLYFSEVFNLGVGERGVLASAAQPFAMAGLVVGASLTNRFMRRRPARILTAGGAVMVISGLLITGMAVAPYLWLAVGLWWILAFLSTTITPAMITIMSVVTPPRVRTFGLSAFGLAVAPGLIFIVISGAVGDHFGIRGGLVVMTGVFLIGALIFMSAGSGVEADIRSATASALASEIARRSKAEGHHKLLVCRDMDVHYGQLQILFKVDFDVEEGEIVALLGTNGAGKSTLLRAISGVTPPSNGAIVFDGENITALPSHEHAERGIVQVPGGKGIFPGLTIEENLKLGTWMFRGDSGYAEDAISQVLEFFPILRERFHEVAGNLSGGQQQMLTLAQAFLSRPRLLMIDELSLGLAPSVVAQLLEIVRAIHSLGTTIILVEQSVNVALTIADRAVFMEKGEIRFSGSAKDLLARPDIVSSVYLRGSVGAGGQLANRSATVAKTAEEVPTVLEVRNIHKSFGGVAALNGASFSLEENRILGLIGPNGAGKTTVFDVITGFVDPDEGSVLLFGDEITDLSPDQRAKLGLCRSFQDARLFPALTVAENIAVALDRHLSSHSATTAALHLPSANRSERRARRRVDRLIELMSLGPNRDKFVRELSTGQRRIVDLACMLAAEPKVLLLDEPSSGIAQAEAEELGPLLQRIKFETGCSILLIEHDMPLIQSVSDELVAMVLGQVVTRGRPDDVVQNQVVIDSYLGTSEEVIRRSGNL